MVAGVKGHPSPTSPPSVRTKTAGMTEARVVEAMTYIRAKQAAQEWLDTFAEVEPEKRAKYPLAQIHFNLRQDNGASGIDFDDDAIPGTLIPFDLAVEVCRFIVAQCDALLVELNVVIT
jgi:hypothetical protein